VVFTLFFAEGTKEKNKPYLVKIWFIS